MEIERNLAILTEELNGLIKVLTCPTFSAHTSDNTRPTAPGQQNRQMEEMILTDARNYKKTGRKMIWRYQNSTTIFERFSAIAVTLT